jgi:hypothetical protein
MMDPLDIDESSYKEFINCIKNKLITNLIITIVTNDDPCHNSGYIWYVNQGEEDLPKYKDGMHVHYKFPVLIYTSTIA